jgi:hypothetical protein
LLADFSNSLAKISRYLPTIRVKKFSRIFRNSNFEIFENSKKNIEKICKKTRVNSKKSGENIFKSQPFDTFNFKFHQICTNWHQNLIFFQNSQNIRNKHDKKTRVNMKTFGEKIISNF